MEHRQTEMDQQRQIYQVIGLMQKNLECVICLDFMKNPVSTKCGHHFCGFCLREFLKTKRSVPCPLCKEPITKRSLVERPHLSEIVNNVRSLITAIELDTGHFSPDRGPQLNFSPSTPEELPTRRTRGSKRKEKEETVTPSDGSNKRRKSDTTGLSQGQNAIQQQSRRSDPTGESQHIPSTKGQSHQRSSTRSQGHQRSHSDGQGLHTKLDHAKKAVGSKSLLDEIETADMKSVTPETSGTSVTPETSGASTGTTTERCSKEKQLHNGQGQSRVTRSKEKTSRPKFKSREKTRLQQDGPDAESLLKYLANESCGAMEVEKSEDCGTSHDLQNSEILSQSSDEENDMAMIYSNVNEEDGEEDKEKQEDVEGIEDENVGNDLISLGKKAKLLKDKLAKTVTFDEINENNNNKSGGDFNDVTCPVAVQQEKDTDLETGDDHFTIYADIDKTVTEATERTSLVLRPKKKLFRQKRKPDEEEEVTQLSGNSLGNSQDVFSKPVRTVTHTYGSKQNTKLDKDRMVKKWLNSTSSDVEKVSNSNSLSEVETQMKEKIQTTSKNKENWSHGVPPHNISVSNMECRPQVSTKRKIFKTKKDHQSNVTVQQVKGKGNFVIRKVSPVRSEKEIEKNKINMDSSQMKEDSQGSDPYEFKTSQRTPQAKKGKTKGKKDKKCNKNPIDIKIGQQTAVSKEEVVDLTSQARSGNGKLGQRSSLRSRSMEHSKASFDHGGNKRKLAKAKSDSMLQQKSEDIEKIIADLTQAEEYDFITCTQEAEDQVTEVQNESPHITRVMESEAGQVEMEIEPTTDKVSQRTMNVGCQNHCKSESKGLLQEKSTEKSQTTNHNKTSDTGVLDTVCQSEEDTESSTLVSDASCIPNTEDSILSRRTRKLRNNIKTRKSVTFTDRVQHIPVKENSSQEQIVRVTREQRSATQKVKVHSQDQLDEECGVQRITGIEKEGHSQGKLASGMKEKRQLSGRVTRGHQTDVNTIQESPQQRLPLLGCGGQQEVTAGVQCTEEQDQCDRHGEAGERQLPDDVEDNVTNSCMTDAIPDTLEDGDILDTRQISHQTEIPDVSTSQENEAMKSVIDQSQTFDPQQEVYTESHCSKDEIPETEHGENINNTFSTQPPDDIQLGAGSDIQLVAESQSNGRIDKSSGGKTNNTKKTRNATRGLKDKSPLFVMETQMSGNTSSDCVSLETQESVSLLVVNDWKEREQADVAVVEESECVTLQRTSEKDNKSVTSQRALEMECARPASRRNKLKCSSPKLASQSTSSLSLTSPPVGSGAVHSHQNDGKNPEAIDEVSKVTSVQDSVTISGSTIIPATAEASRDTTQVIQICEMEDKPSKRHKKDNISTDISSSANSKDGCLSEISTENSQSGVQRSSRSSSRSLKKTGRKEESKVTSLQREPSLSQENEQGNDTGPSQSASKSEKGVKENTAKAKACEVVKVLSQNKSEVLPYSDEDDLTPTLKPIDKSHKRTRVTRHGCSPEDIFMMDSETMGDSAALSIAQNQEGVIDMADFQSLESLQSQGTEENGRSQSREIKQKKDSQSQIILEEADLQSQTTEQEINNQNYNSEKMNIDSGDGDSESGTDKLKSAESQDKEANGKVHTFETITEDRSQCLMKKGNSERTDVADKVWRNKFENTDKEMCSVNVDTDSDLSQSPPTRGTGVRCVRGLATRRRQLESQDSASALISTRSKGKDSTNSPRQQPASASVGNSEGNFRESVEMNNENEDVSAETKFLFKEKIDSENVKSMKLKEKFRKTFKKRPSRSSNIGNTKGLSTPEHSPQNKPSFIEEDIDKRLPVSNDDETERPEVLENLEQNSESDIVIPDSFPCSSKKTKDAISLRQNGDSPTDIQTNSSLKSRTRKGSEDSIEFSTPKNCNKNKSDRLDKTVESVTDESPNYNVRRRHVAGRRHRRPVIDESDDDDEDEMFDASSPLPDVIINRGQQSGKEKTSGSAVIVDSEAEKTTKEKDNKKCDDKDEGKDEPDVIADSEDDYSSSDESDSSRRLNLTSSSAFSSQSEAMTTQNRKALEKDLERMKREIAELEKQLANNQNQGEQTPMEKVKKPEVSEDSDSDLVLEKVEEDQNDPSDADEHNDVIDLATSSPGTKVSQGSRSKELNRHSVDSDESDELFLSPLPPSPPPTPSQSAKKPPAKLPDHILQTTEFLSHFRKTGSQRSSNSQGSVGSDSGSIKCKNKLSLKTANEKDDQVNVLSSPCDNTSRPKKQVSSPMFESSQLTERRYTGTTTADDGDNYSERLSQCRGFLTTGLTYLQTREIQRLAQQNNIKFFGKFNSSVTHVIVKTVHPGQRVCERTLKFFQGVANKCWVLDFQWITDSKAAGQLLPEEKYEIIGDTITGNCHHGPRQSRLSTRPLLEGIHFFCLGTSETLSTEDLQELIERCGGTVVDHPSAFQPGTKLNLAVTCIDLEDEDDLPAPEDTRTYNKLYKKFGLLTVSREWILDTLTVFTTQPLKDYVLTTVRDINIPDLVTRTKAS
ncbi:serine-rich adhesin for platelets-like isoform X2 [Argopecten irradians]|uniref:serine-rich adhesin for platelets-like isoform X2 n=1 Tax=Argopecten irradians TaxID=31199 RepID=UPI0037243101